MRAITSPYRGDLLLGHLLTYGLALALDTAGVDALIHHAPHSLAFEPVLSVPQAIDDHAIAEAVRRTAMVTSAVVEADLEAGKLGNDRRSVIWARGSLANDATRLWEVATRRAALVDGTDDRTALTVLAGIGAPASWGPEGVKPPHGATALDGVLGNHTSDLVRGVMRGSRKAAADAAPETLWDIGHSQLDKTGWAPPGTPAPLVHQWLAVLGLGLLPVAHRPVERSITPATWRQTTPRRSGVVLPLLSAPTSLPRLRALLGLGSLPAVATGAGDAASLAAAAELRALGVPEVVAFERLDGRGAGSSVAFTFRRGERHAL